MHCLKMDAYSIIQPIGTQCMDVPLLAKNKADVHSLCGIWLVCSSFTNVCQSSTVISYVE